MDLKRQLEEYAVIEILRPVQIFIKFFGLFPLKINSYTKKNGHCSSIFTILTIFWCVGFGALLYLKCQNYQIAATVNANARLFMNAALVISFYANLLFSWRHCKAYLKFEKLLIQVESKMIINGITVDKKRPRMHIYLLIFLTTTLLSCVIGFDLFAQLRYMIDTYKSILISWAFTFVCITINTINNMSLLANAYVIWILFDCVIKLYKTVREPQFIFAKGNNLKLNSTLKNVFDLYFDIRILIEDLNKIYSVQLATNYLLWFLTTILQSHFILIVRFNKLRILIGVNLIVCLTIYNLAIIALFQHLQYKDRYFKRIFSSDITDRILNSDWDTKTVMCYYSNTISLSGPIYFSALDVLEINYKLIFAMLSTLSAYLIIMMQFTTESEQNSSGSSSKNYGTIHDQSSGNNPFSSSMSASFSGPVPEPFSAPMSGPFSAPMSAPMPPGLMADYDSYAPPDSSSYNLPPESYDMNVSNTGVNDSLPLDMT